MLSKVNSRMTPDNLRITPAKVLITFVTSMTLTLGNRDTILFCKSAMFSASTLSAVKIVWGAFFKDMFREDKIEKRLDGSTGPCSNTGYPCFQGDTLYPKRDRITNVDICHHLHRIQ